MIIGINGPIGSGKNEVARILEKNFGFKAIGFADKLKESAAAIFKIKPDMWNELKNSNTAKVTLEWTDEVDGHEWYREIVISAREFLKRYGTESHRDILGYNIWVDALIGNLTAQDNVAIYDARFDNELRAIKQHRGVNVQVRRPGHVWDPTHPSETAPDPELIDHIINNDSTLEWLEVAVNSLVRAEKLATPNQLETKDNLYQLPLRQPEPDFSPLNAS